MIVELHAIVSLKTRDGTVELSLNKSTKQQMWQERLTCAAIEKSRHSE
jgi:hypothetical protein